jgi:hypothetical protein
MVMDLAIEGQGAFDDVAPFIKHKDAAAGAANILQRQLQNALEQLAQIKLNRQFATDGIKEVEGGLYACCRWTIRRHVTAFAVTLWPLYNNEGGTAIRCTEGGVCVT